jgi:hypothetical protein
MWWKIVILIIVLYLIIDFIRFWKLHDQDMKNKEYDRNL